MQTADLARMHPWGHVHGGRTKPGQVRAGGRATPGGTYALWVIGQRGHRPCSLQVAGTSGLHTGIVYGAWFAATRHAWMPTWPMQSHLRSPPVQPAGALHQCSLQALSTSAACRRSPPVQPAGALHQCSLQALSTSAACRRSPHPCMRAARLCSLAMPLHSSSRAARSPTVAMA